MSCVVTVSTLFVGNLSFNVGEEDLSEYFSNGGYTPDSVRIISSQGQSKGYTHTHTHILVCYRQVPMVPYFSRYGYVEFSSSEDAKKAMEEMTGDLDGRTLRLDMATPRTPGGGDGGRGGRGTPRGGRGGTPRGGRGGMYCCLLCDILVM